MLSPIEEDETYPDTLSSYDEATFHVCVCVEQSTHIIILYGEVKSHVSY
jgi:hypothetical protein